MGQNPARKKKRQMRSEQLRVLSESVNLGPKIRTRHSQIGFEILSGAVQPERAKVLTGIQEKVCDYQKKCPPAMVMKRYISADHLQLNEKRNVMETHSQTANRPITMVTRVKKRNAAWSHRCPIKVTKNMPK